MMMDKAENITENLRFDPEKGEISFKGVRYLLIRPETVMHIQRDVEEELGEDASRVIARGGFEGGSLSTKAYKEKFGLSNEEIVEYMCNMGSSIGWGRFRLIELSKKHLIVEVSNSPFAEVYGSSEDGICHMIGGVLAGLGMTVFESDIESIEEKCVSKGDDICRFIIKSVD
ncbi:MAG: V4R domain-containing protein [Thermoplasmata archaeon]